MKILTVFVLASSLLCAQEYVKYEPNTEHPFGTLNPKAPKQVADFAPLIGVCDCISTARKPDQTWGEPQKMTWTFKYIMNGHAVQDETLKEDGSHSGSIRQFNADSSKWYVHYYSNTGNTPSLPTWEGTKRGDSIVLYREQKAPNGTDGYYRLTFNDISENGFNWIGEWVDLGEGFSYPTWKINCTKRTSDSDKMEIMKKATAFSEAYLRKDANAIANFYTSDAKIFPNNTDIITGTAAIEARWTLPEHTTPIAHTFTAKEITIIDNYAYDYGYYEGSNRSKGEENSFKGKYVVIWKKVDGDWKIYLDIWNSL